MNATRVRKPRGAGRAYAARGENRTRSGRALRADAANKRVNASPVGVCRVHACGNT
jgi:hypothetical protein